MSMEPFFIKRTEVQATPAEAAKTAVSDRLHRSRRFRAACLALAIGLGGIGGYKLESAGSRSEQAVAEQGAIKDSDDRAIGGLATLGFFGAVASSQIERRRAKKSVARTVREYETNIPQSFELLHGLNVYQPSGLPENPQKVPTSAASTAKKPRRVWTVGGPLFAGFGASNLGQFIAEPKPSNIAFLALDTFLVANSNSVSKTEYNRVETSAHSQIDEIEARSYNGRTF